VALPAPTDPDPEAMPFAEAAALATVGDREAACKAFEELAERAPDSPYAPHALLRLGDLRLEDGRRADAARVFAAAAGRSRGPVAISALRRTARAWWWSGEREPAVEGLRAVLRGVGEALERGDNEERLTEVATEATTWLAGVLADDDWDEDGSRDPGWVMGRIEEHFPRPTPLEAVALLRIPGALARLGFPDTSVVLAAKLEARLRRPMQDATRREMLVAMRLRIDVLAHDLTRLQEKTRGGGARTEDSWTDLATKAARRRLRRFSHCYEYGLRRRPRLTGSVSVLIRPSGSPNPLRPVSGEVTDDAVRAPTVTRCLARHAARLPLPWKRGDRPAAVALRFSLSPGP